jgi:drug/metabolite transporter (DMT)-like permease
VAAGACTTASTRKSVRSARSQRQLAVSRSAFCLRYLFFSRLCLPAATGALLLFGAVQATMIGVGIYNGERLRALQLAGLALALGGLVALLVPDPAILVAPPLLSAVLMLAAGAAWGVYSLRGKQLRGTEIANVPFLEVL